MGKKIFLLLTGLCLLLSCAKDDSGIGDSLSIQISVSVHTFGAEGGTVMIDVRSDDEWLISSEIPEWLSVKYISESRLSFNAISNETGDKRSCKIIFQCGDVSQTLYIYQRDIDKLNFIGDKNILLPSDKSEFSVKVDANVEYDVLVLTEGDEWLAQKRLAIGGGSGNIDLSCKKSMSDILNDRVVFIVEENESEQSRSCIVVIRNDEISLSDTLHITQAGKNTSGPEDTAGDTWVDGEWVALQKASAGSVNLVIMGDGFTSEHLSKGGYYQSCMEQAFDYFFSLEPYSTYRDYFNVYMVVAESEDEGVGNKHASGISSFKNKFGTAYGSGTEIVCNADVIFEYARKVNDLEQDEIMTVLVVLNSDKYAGTAYLYKEGSNIALCPMSTEDAPNDFQGIVRHEAGGHAFGLLCDEYVYYDKNMPQNRILDIKEWQELGFYLNLDFTDNISDVLWSDLIGKDKYEAVGVYEGGYEYRYGVWRCEENSCMNNNIPYYNAQSRKCIVQRIMSLSGFEFSIDDFMCRDMASVDEVKTRVYNYVEKYFEPLAPPVLNASL